MKRLAIVIPYPTEDNALRYFEMSRDTLPNDIVTIRVPSSWVYQVEIDDSEIIKKALDA